MENEIRPNVHVQASELALLSNIAAEHIDGMRYFILTCPVSGAAEGYYDFYENAEQADLAFDQEIKRKHVGESVFLCFVLKQD